MWVQTRVSALRRETPNPRLSIKARGLNTRVSTSRREGSTPASQPQGTRARHPRINLRARGSKAHVSVITALVMGPVAAHIAGKLAPHCGAFLGGTFTPETSINSPAAMRNRGGETTQETRDRQQTTHRQTEREARESSTLQQACCVQVAFCLPSL